MRNVRLIALDLDGTLLDSGKRLSEENARELEKAAQAGIEFVPADAVHRAALDGVTDRRGAPAVRLNVRKIELRSRCGYSDDKRPREHYCRNEERYEFFHIAVSFHPSTVGRHPLMPP